MITSNEVSALMQQQQQQQSMLGMGAPSAVVGQSQYPPQFNFGHNSYLGGTLSGSGGMMGAAASGVAGAGSLMSTGAGIAALMPSSMVGGALGGTLGGLLGLNPVSLGLMAGAAGVGAVGSSMNNGLRINGQVGQMLSAANFANPNAPNGFGFGFNDQSRMTNTIMGMGASNPFVGQQDQMQMLNQFQQMGLDKGVTSMGKMIEKFKEFSKTTEDVATQLGKTVTEVTGLVQNLRGSGFYSAAEVTGMSARMSASSSYGINMQQQQQMMQSMSQNARGAGLSGASGATMGVNLAQAFGSANQMGLINENLLMDLTGTSNAADASQAMAQSLGGRFSSAFTQGGMLENMMAGFSKVGANGKLQIDQAALGAMASGRMSFEDLRGRAGDTIANNRSQFATNRRRLASDFLSSDQGMGAVLGTFRSMAQNRAQGGDISEEEAFTLLMKEYNIADERQSELLFDMAQNAESILNNNLKNRAETLAAEKRRAYIAKHRSFAGYKAKMGNELSKLTSNKDIGYATARMSTGLSAGMNALEKQYFGVEDSTAGLYTTAAGTSFRDSFMSGDLDSLGSSLAIEGAGLSASQARLQSLAGNAYSKEGRKSFLDALSSGVDTDALSGISLKGLATDGNLTKMISTAAGFSDGLKEFEYETAYSGPNGRDAESFMRNRAFGILGREDDNIYSTLMRQAKTRAAKALGKSVSDVTDQEAQFVIANQGGDSSAALQRYMNRNRQGGSSLTNQLQDDFLSKAGTGDLGLGGAIASHVALGTTGGAVVGGGIFSIPSAAIGAGLGLITGTMHGLYNEGTKAEYEAKLKGSAGALLAKLNSKGKLKSFDKKMQEAMRDHPGDREAAMQKVAKQMSEELGEAVSAEDVGASLKALYKSSGDKTYNERLSSGSYRGALSMTQAASDYQMLEMTKGHLTSLRDSIQGEDVEGLEGLQAALATTDESTLISGSREAMLDVARKAATGDFTYDGDNAMVSQLTESKQLYSDLSQFAGKDLSAIDKQFGQDGLGAKLRKLAGKRKGGVLTKEELKEMAAQLAVDSTLKVAETGAKVGATSVDGMGDNEVITATASLVNSTNKLAVYVDNIAATLTGNETAGKKIPGIVKIDTEAS